MPGAFPGMVTLGDARYVLSVDSNRELVTREGILFRAPFAQESKFTSYIFRHTGDDTSMGEATRILLLVNEGLISKVRSALANAGFVCQTPTECLSKNAWCELVVSDQPELTVLPQPVRLLLSRGLVGLVRLGDVPGGDVWLPRDWTVRELVLCCRLLAEVVRLRRANYRQRRRQQHLKRLAYHDPLTGLFNRRAWQWHMEHAHQGGSQPALLAILDIDHFKQVNDRLGLSGGDRVLRAAATAIATSVRQGDLVARLGGDEFGVWVLNVPAEVARQVVDRVRHEASTAASHAAGSPVTVSAGMAVGAATEFAPLFAAAQQALCQAKETGRDRTCLAN